MNENQAEGCPFSDLDPEGTGHHCAPLVRAVTRPPRPDPREGTQTHRSVGGVSVHHTAGRSCRMA